MQDNPSVDDDDTAGPLANGIAAALTEEHRAIDADIELSVGRMASASAEDLTQSTQPLIDAIELLRRHIYIEEHFLFPIIREAGLAMPVFVMLREHGQIWRQLNDLSDVLADAGPDTFSSEEIATRCQELLTILDAHNTKEEPVIYPRTDTDIPAEIRAELAEFLRNGTVPENWACEQALA